jgi:hypothetical protein
MFPDPSLRWRPFPSILDGIDRPPFVLDRGLWNGILALIVVGAPPRGRSYGVQIRCQGYLAVEEALYSVADHGAGTARYNGAVYIKETSDFPAQEAFEVFDRRQRKARRFLFVGSDFCYETIGFDEPVVQAFASTDAAYAWQPDTPN